VGRAIVETDVRLDLDDATGPARTAVTGLADEGRAEHRPGGLERVAAEDVPREQDAPGATAHPA